MTYALDSNIVIKYLRRDVNVMRNLLKISSQKGALVIPIAVDYEVRRGFRIMPAPSKERHYQALVESCRIISMNIKCWEKAMHIYSELYRKRFTAGEIDILIASMCIANNYILVTNNIIDFKNIEGLKLTDWSQLA